MTNKPGLRQPDNVLSHWYTLVEGVHFSSMDFYAAVEDELAQRKVPRLAKSRVELFQGSLASDKRVYLRLARERYAFDVCAAPFGTDYFFSLRLVEKPRSWLLFLAFLFAFYLVLGAWQEVTGNPSILVGVGGVVALAIYLRYRATGNLKVDLRIPAEMPDVDSWILNIAVIGHLYELARKDTYYRQDTRLMYYQVISEVVRRKVEEFSGEQGIRVVETYEYSPLFRDLYKKDTIKPPPQLALPDAHD